MRFFNKILIAAIIFLPLGCAQQGVAGKFYRGPAVNQWPSRDLPSDINADIQRAKSVVARLQARGKRPFTLREFASVMEDLQSIEQKYGELNNAYSSLASFGEVTIAPRKWVRLSLQSFCLNSGRASPSANEVYTFKHAPSDYEIWLPDLMRYARLQKIPQRKIQEIVWKLNRGATSTGADTAVVAARRYLGKADEELLGKWSRATFDNRQRSIIIHWEKHAMPMGRTVEEYTRDAVEFFNNNKQWKKVILNDGTEGLLFKNKGHPGGYFTTDGRIVTFWYK